MLALAAALQAGVCPHLQIPGITDNDTCDTTVASLNPALRATQPRVQVWCVLCRAFLLCQVLLVLSLFPSSVPLFPRRPRLPSPPRLILKVL